LKKNNVANVEVAGVTDLGEYLFARLFIVSDKVSGESTEYLAELSKVFLSKCRFERWRPSFIFCCRAFKLRRTARRFFNFPSTTRLCKSADKFFEVKTRMIQVSKIARRQ
jgi:hypothetical protein